MNILINKMKWLKIYKTLIIFCFCHYYTHQYTSTWNGYYFFEKYLRIFFFRTHVIWNLREKHLILGNTPQLAQNLCDFFWHQRLWKKIFEDRTIRKISCQLFLLSEFSFHAELWATCKSNGYLFLKSLIRKHKNQYS